MNVYLAEFVGTALLITLGCGVNAAASLSKSYAEKGGWVLICFGWGMAVTFSIYAVGSISGAHINPAVTLGLAFGGDFAWSLVPGYILCQVLGAFLGATLIWLQYLPHWKKTEDQGTKLGVFCTSPALSSRWSNVFSEIMGTFVLLFAIMFIGVNEFTQGLNPIVVGTLIVSIGMSLGGTTGYAINPARDFGPRLAHFLLPIINKGHSNWKYSWVPILGPMLGGVFGVLVYQALFENKIETPFYISGGLVLVVIVLSIREQND